MFSAMNFIHELFFFLKEELNHSNMLTPYHKEYHTFISLDPLNFMKNIFNNLHFKKGYQ
jgi:hypothetical protein